MKTYIVPVIAAGSLAIAAMLSAPAAAQEEASLSRRGLAELERGDRQGQSEERRAREAYEGGDRQGQMEEREGRARNGHSAPYERGLYGSGGEERSEREGQFGEREHRFGD